MARELGAYVIEIDHPDLPQCAGMHGPDTPCDGKRGKHNCEKPSLGGTNNAKDIVAKFTGSTRNYGVTWRSGFLIIDEDTANLDTYADSIGETVPETFEVGTGRDDGRHRYYLPPAGVKLGNGAGRLPKGIDVRANTKTGYVVGPGSKHQSGRTYTATWDRKPVPAPQWLVDALTPPPVDEHDDQADVGKAEIAPRVAELLALPVTPEVDKSERFHAIVGAAKAAGMSKSATTLALLPWCVANKKYAVRVPEEVSRSWTKLPAPGEQPASERQAGAEVGRHAARRDRGGAVHLRHQRGRRTVRDSARRRQGRADAARRQDVAAQPARQDVLRPVPQGRGATGAQRCAVGH